VSDGPGLIKLPTPPDDGSDGPRGRRIEPPRAAIPSQNQITWVGISLVVMSLQYSIRQLAREIAQLKRVSPRSAQERAAQQARVSRLEADVRALRQQLAQEEALPPQQQRPVDAGGAPIAAATADVDDNGLVGGGGSGSGGGGGGGDGRGGSGGQKWTLEAWNRWNGRRIRLPPKLTSQVDLMDCLARRLHDYIVCKFILSPPAYLGSSLSHSVSSCLASSWAGPNLCGPVHSPHFVHSWHAFQNFRFTSYIFIHSTPCYDRPIQHRAELRRILTSLTFPGC
jgi:hypothetical protein